MGAVLQAVCMAIIGVVFAKAGVIDANARKAISTISMKMTIPCLLLTSLITCPQGGHTQAKDSCPEISTVIQSAWLFLIFPFVWVFSGILCGTILSSIGCVPVHLRRTLACACAFSNSTGLPIVLLTALAAADVTADFDSPQMQLHQYLLLLSVYQITYPMIQWSLGASMLKQPSASQPIAPVADSEPSSDTEARSFQKIRNCAENFFVPPVIAVLAGVFIGLIPPLRVLLVDTKDFNNDRPLEFLFNAVTAFGGAAVPLNMCVLGASLANIPALSSIHWASTLATVFGKLFIHPALAYSILFLMKKSGFLTMVTGGDATLNHAFVLVAGIVTATPTANNLTVMAELHAGREQKQALASMIFVMYCFAPFTLTAWIVVFVMLGENEV